MIKKIDPGLFACLMRLTPGARKDLLEYIGETRSGLESLGISALAGHMVVDGARALPRDTDANPPAP